MGLVFQKPVPADRRVHWWEELLSPAMEARQERPAPGMATSVHRIAVCMPKRLKPPPAELRACRGLALETNDDDFTARVGVPRQSDLRNSSIAFWSLAASVRKPRVAWSASPPCRRMASRRFTVTPSCINRVRNRTPHRGAVRTRLRVFWKLLGEHSLGTWRDARAFFQCLAFLCYAGANSCPMKTAQVELR